MTTTSVLQERWTTRIRGLTLNEAARLLPYATGLSAGLSIALVSFKIWRTPQFAFFSVVVTWALLAFVVSVSLSTILRRRATSLPAWIDAESATSWILSLELGIFLLVVPVLFLAKGVPEDEMTGWLWPLVNKRWLLALYNLAIATFLVFPVAIARWRSQPVADVESSVPVRERPAARARWFPSTAGAVVVLATCWYVAGTPWHLERHHRSVEWHEQMHFGALQAISKGYLPAVGPAASAYGPGSQILTYGLTKLMGPFDLVSIRKAWAAQHLLAVIVVGMAAYWWLGVVPAIAILCLATMYSPLAFFYTLGDGTFTGFFGWANPLRYIAPLIVVPALAGAATRDSKASTVAWLGGAWGLGSWLAQESLTTTTTALVLLLTLLWLTRTISGPRAVWLGRNLIIGFASVVIPVLCYYAAHGAAGALLRTYFAYPRAVAAGFGNDWWPPQDSASPARFSYYLTLPFVIGCAICAVWRLPGLRPVTPLDHHRTRFLAFICVQLVCYQTALLRSDSTHLMNSMIALPFVLVLGFIDLPRWLAARPIGRWGVRVGFVLLAVIVYPSFRRSPDLSGIWGAARRFHASSLAAESTVKDDDLSFTRTRPLAPDEPLFLGDPPISVREFDRFATELRAVVGQRKTYFMRIGWIAGGLIAFVPDLMPAPHPIGGDLFTINDRARTQIADHIRAHPRDYEAFIGPSLTDPEARAFLESHPGAVILERPLGASTVYILLSQT